MSWSLRRSADRDTGWRDITDLVPGRVSGTLYLRRTGMFVTLRFSNLVVADSGTWWVTLNGVLPAGFRQSINGFTYMPLTQYVSISSAGPVRVDSSGNLTIYDMAGSKRASGTCIFLVEDAMPPQSTWPGVSV